MRCLSCNSEHSDATKFCGNCGQPLRNRCAECGSENPPQFKFCGECGAGLHASAASSMQAAAAPTTSASFAERPSIDAHEVPDGERKTVTALLPDTKASMALMDDLN